MALNAGDRLGPYEITGELGAGGMGLVLRAHDTQLHRDVALKILPDAFASDPDRLARFQREAQVLASLNHPGIAAIYGIEEAEGTRALVLELVEGSTLADRIADGPIPLDEALPIAKQIAEALEAAHEAGVIHRDLKPANIKVRPDGTVKVLDFGLAKALDAAPEGDPSHSPTLTAVATQKGVIMGTAAYMSPEQARGKPVDRRADVWAFGVVLYEMLSGGRPFDSEDVSAILADVIRTEPQWDRLPADLPPALNSFLRRCLQKDRRQRVRDIGDMRLAMEGAFESSALPIDPRLETATVQREGWRRAVPWVAGVAMGSVLTGLAVWRLTDTAPARPMRVTVPFGVGEELSRPGRRSVAVSPDGALIVYQANQQLFLRQLDQARATPIAGTQDDARGPFFSPNGQWVGFWADGELRKVSVTGGSPVAIAEVESPVGNSWSTDGTMLFALEGSGIWRVSDAGGTPELLFPAEDGEQLQGLQVLPGGEWILSTSRPRRVTSWDEAQIVALSTVTGERTVVIEGGRDARYLPTGHLVYVLNGELFAVAFDPTTRIVTGGPVSLIESVFTAPNNAAAHLDIADNGSLVYLEGSGTAQTEQQLVWVDRQGDVEPLAVESGAFETPRVSPDGTRIAVTLDAQDNADVWIYDLPRNTSVRLTFAPEPDFSPLWTPDGQRVVFASVRDGGGIFWKAADGTGAAERLGALGSPFSWSSDGQGLVFAWAGDVGVLSLNADRTGRMLLESDLAEAYPAVSPDGRWIAYFTNETGQSEVYVQPFPNVEDGKWQISQAGGFSPVWGPDSRELFYRNGSTTDMMAVRIETDPTFISSAPEVLFRGIAYRWAYAGILRPFDIAPDGQRFLMIRESDRADGVLPSRINVVLNWHQELLERVPTP